MGWGNKIFFLNTKIAFLHRVVFFMAATVYDSFYQICMYFGEYASSSSEHEYKNAVNMDITMVRMHFPSS